MTCHVDVLAVRRHTRIFCLLRACALLCLALVAGAARAQVTYGTISPNHGSTKGGTTLTVTGSGFTGAPGSWNGTIGGQPVSVSAVTSTTLTLTSPALSGGQNLVVALCQGCAPVDTGLRYSTDEPSVSSITPTHGPTSGTSIQVNGGSWGFVPTTIAVTVGGVPATLNGGDADKLFVTVPAGSGVNLPVVVTSQDGRTSNTNVTFSYDPPTVSSISPNSGTTSGGTTVTITGTNLKGATAVTIAGAPAAAILSADSTSLTAITGVGGAGSGSVVVVTPSGSSPPASSYTYVAPTAVRYYNVTFSGPNESPPNASPGVGIGTVIVDTNASTLKVSGGFSGLQGTVTQSHIHAATTIPLQSTAGVATQTPSFAGFPSGVTSGTYTQTFDMTQASNFNASYITANGGTAAAAFAALALAIDGGKAYWNIHTTSFGGGEVRGFLTPASAPVYEVQIPSFAPRPFGITTGPDGNLWFTENTRAFVGRVTPAGVVMEFPIPLAGSRDIVAGPGGALWYTQPANNRVGKITTAGVVTEFTMPTAASSPFGIAAGPDGNVWVTANGIHRIARVTPAGAITEFTLPTPNSGPKGIVAGPDGALWYAASAGLIGRITTAGAISEFRIPSGAGAERITAGPDGALWFTLPFPQRKIGRITTLGIITEFDIPGADTYVSDITAGPDGALWFTEATANKIGRISTAGVISQVPLAVAGSTPTAITTGPDGAVWFTEDEQSHKGLDRLTPPFPTSWTVAGTGGFDAGATSEILWRGSEGSVAMWFLSGGAIASGPLVSGGFGGWHIVGTGDFNGDGKRDILWRSTAGHVGIWTMNGATITGAPIVTVVPTDWSIAGVGDFDGDGKADILWRNVNGDVAIWLMNGSNIVFGPVLGNVSPGWIIAGVGDFDGNGKSDILWRGPTGEVAIWFMNGASIVSGPVVGGAPQSWRIVGAGDFDGNGRADILWRSSAGEVAFWFMNGAAIVSGPSIGVIANDWMISGVADFTGDGKSDILWRHSNGTTGYWQMNGAAATAAPTLAIVP